VPNPNPSGTAIDLTGLDPDEFAQWLTARFGGNLHANRIAARDVWKYSSDSNKLQDYFGTGEVLDDLMDYVQERRGVKSDNKNPRQKGKDGKYGKAMWLTSPSKKQAERLGFGPRPVEEEAAPSPLGF
jgi:hypothetical protein